MLQSVVGVGEGGGEWEGAMLSFSLISSMLFLIPPQAVSILCYAGLLSTGKSK